MSKADTCPPDLYFDPDFLNVTLADQYFLQLQDEVQWRQDDIMMFGKSVKIPRLQAFMADEGLNYRYSGHQLHRQPWHPALLALRIKLEQRFSIRFNAALLNLYRDGDDSMGWHQDNEPELGDEPIIASISLGAERRFLLRPHPKQHPQSPTAMKYEYLLSHGSLLWMGPALQKTWQHSVPKTKKVIDSRINITFRQLVNGEND